MPKPSKSRRTKKARVDPVAKRATKLGDAIAHQAANDSFEFEDITNDAAGQRFATIAMNDGYATKEDKDDKEDKRRTVRRMPKIVELKKRGVINEHELKACVWYLHMHGARYDTIGLTANYGGAGGRSSTNFDHLPKTRAQQDAFDHFDFARAGINPFLVALFERVVLHGRPLGRLTRSFRMAIAQLIERIEGRVQL